MKSESGNSQLTTMTFLIPSEYEKDDLPSPNDKGVTIVQNPARTLAALRFSGVISSELWKEKSQVLIQTLDQSKYQASSEILFFGYDPPMVPGPLRRNEIVVELVLKETESATQKG